MTTKQPRGITATSVICQIDTIAYYITGIGSRRYTFAELHQIADAFWAAYEEAFEVAQKAPEDDDCYPGDAA
jgi:hypothetical protein